ncbi:MAG: protein kinase [Bryobacteraceae bacterium]
MSLTGPSGDSTMDAQEKLKELYLRALAMETTERDLLLQREAADSATREEILRLLSYSGQAARYFSRLSEEIETLVRIEPLLECGEVLAGRFAIVRFLARGGMGEVYEAADRELGGRLALKVMRPGIVEHAGGLQRFRDEIRLGREVNNPHVCRVFDVARHTGGGRDLIFFTMELLEGATLSDRLQREGPLPLPDARNVIRQMAAGLDAAHRAGILHRDFKSRNVMLCGPPTGLRVVITDFGLSRQMGAQASHLLDGATPAYAAPEQLEKKPETERSDVYAFGVVLYELTTGRLPSHRDAQPPALPVMPADASVPPPRRLRPDLPRAWDSVILRCLDRDPAGRFRSAGEVAQALGCMDGPAAVSRRVWLGGAAAASVAGVAAWWSWRTGPAAEPPSLAVLPLDTDSAEMQVIADGIVDRLTDTLTQLPGIRVIARTAVQRYKDAGKNLAETGKRFHVRYLITGAMRKKGSRLHVTTEILEAGDGLRLWGGTQDLDQDRVEGLNFTLSRAVVHSIRMSAQPARMAQIEKTATKNGAAYQCYLLGRYFAARRTREASLESVSQFKQALTLDPNFADAWAALGSACFDLTIRESNRWEPRMQESMQAATRALQLDPNLWEAHLVVGCNQRLWQWNYAAAEQSFRKAIELNPGSPAAHRWYAQLLTGLDRAQEALPHIEQAVSLDPFNSDLQVRRGTTLLYCGRVDDALAAYQSVVQSDPGYENAYLPMSDALELKGLRGEAIAAAQKAVALTARASFALSEFGWLSARDGRVNDATAILDELLARYPNNEASATDIAYVYLGLNDRDKAFEWLDRGVLRRNINLMLLKVGIQYRVLRADSRYRSLLTRVGFAN